MGRLLDIWRSLGAPRQLGLIAAAGLVAAGVVLGIAALNRPGDVLNEGAVFHKQKEHVVKTVNWPIYGFDVARTRYLPAKDLDPPLKSAEWTFQAGKLLEFSPIAVNGTLYLMDKDALFYAISADKGKVEWKRKIGTLNASSPAYADGKLFGVSLQPSQVVALDAKRKGKILWRHELPGRSESSPLVRAHRVIFG